MSAGSVSTGSASTARAPAVKNLFLTGATGVLGGRLLLEILTATSANVFCLVRADSVEQARARLESVLFSYDVERTSAGELGRVIPVLGDVAQAQLGLNAQDYQRLQATVDRVLHCAANVSLVASYGKLQPVNVKGTQQVIDFCLGGDIPLLYASSFSVVGDKLYQDGFELQETDLDFGQNYRDMDYERSKYEAEKAVHQAGERGLRWAIVRPGNIWGDSANGRYPLAETRVKGIYYEMIKSLVETGLTFRSSEDFDITPVDYVAKAALYASLHSDDFHGKTLNLTNPQPITYDDIVIALREFGYQLDVVINEDYFEALTQNRMLREGKPYRSSFTDLMALFYSSGDITEKAKYATGLTRQWLAGSGIACAACDHPLLFRYFNYLIDAGFIVPPEQQRERATIVEHTRQSSFLEQLFDADLR
ncbi:thioester reductase domain-containing protein [Dickeya dadantii]|uniref:thioester reductase domain-containing protein n=1 Tax=Dickeya dadantii TaxID=204038 RepID=UPI001CF1A148|nr:thioester reductase domain-containing protein [Dickeya dadantii]MCA7013926.1 thioester reductase domain-containing protein [Dickeya dadantii]